MATATSIPFSQELEQWLKSSGDKTLAGLIEVFAEKSFALIFLLLLALPALPIPTGGVTHVTEAIAMLISLEMIFGRRTIWLPQRWKKLNVGKHLAGKAAPRLLGVIRWFERYSRRRGSGLLSQALARSVIGLIVLTFTIFAFIAPPFSGLDTLPSLGVVVISLALILEDILIVLGGIVIGSIGVALELAAGIAFYKSLLHFF